MVKANPSNDSIPVFNAGINGNNVADLLARLDKDVLRRSPDLVILMIGTNDMLNTRNMLSISEYEKNYQALISRIEEKASLVLMTIPPVYSPYIVMRKPELKWNETRPQERVDSANAVIRLLAEKNKCMLIDLNKILTERGGSHPGKTSLFKNEANSGINDGVHPTADGYRVIAAAVYQRIHLLKPEAKRIVCFGDSITYGYEVEGGGSTEGQCYPALLKRMLEEGER